MNSVKIEMIHDAVCSWCPIGYSHLKKALRNKQILGMFTFLPSELNPDMSPEGEDVWEHLKRRYGWTDNRLISYRNYLSSSANEAGVTIDFEKRTTYYNSNLAHRFIHLAEKENLQQEANETLINAYFKHGLNISKLDIILELAEEIGMNPKQTKQGLMSTETTQGLEDKKLRVSKLNLSSIPAFIFNGDFFVSGSNSVEYFENLLTDMSREIGISEGI